MSRLRLILVAAIFACPRAAGSLQPAVPYDQYGQFDNVGSPDYSYRLDDKEALKRHLPTGVYPNIRPAKAESRIDSNTLIQKHKVWVLPTKECLDFWGRLDPWQSYDPRFAEGVRQFNYAQCLERAGRIPEAIEAYYATVIHFPFEQDPLRNFPAFWPDYLGVKAMDAVYFLTRQYPNLGLRYMGGEIRVENGYDDKESNDVLRIWPGRLFKVSHGNKPSAEDLSSQEPERTIGSSKGVELSSYGNGHWLMKVRGRPMFVRGVHYVPPPVPPAPEPEGFWKKWKSRLSRPLPQADREVASDDLSAPSVEAAGFWDTGWTADRNENGRPDILETWIDGNKNGRADRGEPKLGDFGLMALAGVNTVVLPRPPSDTAVLEEAHRRWGLYFIIADSLNTDRAALPEPWMSRINYADPADQNRELLRLRRLVNRHKNKDYLLGWALGSHSIHSAGGLMPRSNAKAYLEFAAKAVAAVKEIDQLHPVIFVTHDLRDLPAVVVAMAQADVLGVTAYRGFHGFGESFWRPLKEIWGKPVLVMDYGMPSYAAGTKEPEAEKLQSLALRRSWQDIEYHQGGGAGAGVSVGGCVWEWVDGWWRDAPSQTSRAHVRDSTPGEAGPFADGHDYAEFYGLMALGEGPEGALLRQPRKAYWTYGRLWKNKE
ncbi:MAG: hypothetical protein HYT79_06470 [Elusimicrobia bacterium]|nr:hypothetical protein [Elusimicrobiota bacterium]